MTRRIQTVLKLNAVTNLGPSGTRKLFKRLRQDDTELEHLLEFNHADLVEMGLTDRQAIEFLEEHTIDIAEQLVEQGLRVVTFLDEDAPQRMIDSKSSPWYFSIGRLDIMRSKAIGFAGSRDASPEAIDLASEIAREAAAEGWVVISGGARGVDHASHMAVLESGGETVILLPQGIATWRMPEELDLDRVLMLSEFHPFDEWGAFRAMQRNKSVVELSDLLVIPQTGERGGTWNAGEYAVKQKKRVFVADLGSKFPGNQKLIKLGAPPLEWSGDRSFFTSVMEPEGDGDHTQTSLF